MYDQRIGTRTVCLTTDTLPYGRPEHAARSCAGEGPRPPSASHARREPRAGASVAAQLAVGRTVRADRVLPEPLDLVLLVVLEVALEPEPLRVALVGQDVRRHPVEEPPVVAHHDSAARELQQCTFQAGQRLDVEVVGGLV